MTNGLATIQTNALVLDDAKIELLSKTIANGAPPLELEMFIGVCNRTGLDPFAKQIYFIKRGDKWSTQTSIDGYRLIADRSGKYAGSDEVVYIDDGKRPETATVTVYKMLSGQRCPFTATARWSEYYPGDKSGAMWNRMPYLMLGKCAESLALRKAFPAELSGLYTREEMMQADNDEPVIEVLGETVVQATGEIVDMDLSHTTTETWQTWSSLIDTAETLADLDEIKDGMKEAGVTEETDYELARHWKARHNRLKIDAAKAKNAA
jgi:phage recombination protein Bet